MHAQICEIKISQFLENYGRAGPSHTLSKYIAIAPINPCFLFGAFSSSNFQLLPLSPLIQPLRFSLSLLPSTMADPEHREVDENAPAEDEDTGAQIAPIIKLEEVAVSTGEEDEDAILDLKAKLYRFDREGNQWKERGAGSVKLLKHKVTGKVRLVMRQSKTLKICANHLVLSSMTVQEHAGNEKSCLWHASDFSDGELKDELFCIRFASVDNCKSFMEKFQEVAESQKEQTETEETTEAAELLSKLKVEEKSKDEKSGDDAPTPVKEEKESSSEATKEEADQKPEWIAK
ncbi:hypothetical protein V2J09_012679 [Rumex salicifolius]